MTKAIEKKRITIHGRTMSYVDRGRGRPVVFLHGNPTSSYLWRNIVAPLAARARCIAPDLMGMGDSEKLVPSSDAAYSFAEHSRYLDTFLDAMAFEEPIVLVVHDWGSALGFDWARRFPSRVRGIVYMEAILGVLSLDGRPPEARATFEAMRSDAGERLVLEENVFIEKLLPVNVLRPMSAEVHDEYRRPFREPGEGRRATLAWPRQLPFDGFPEEICALVGDYVRFLATSEVPKLFVNAEPGRVVSGALREVARSFPNQSEVTVEGLHYPQEDSPAEIAAAIDAWLTAIETSESMAHGASA